jgi:hypothetical protein
MQQLAIEYFFPLTEQISLDLDFTPSKEYEEAKRKAWLSNSVLMSNGAIGSTTWANVEPTTFQFRPNPNTVGHWKVTEHIQVYQEKKPRWLVRKMSELLLGWKWMDK